VKTNDIRRLKEDRVLPLLAGNEDLALAGKVSKDSIDFLTRQIRAIETFIEKKLELKESYRKLVTIPGIGKILGLTIMLETGPVERFEKVGNFASYCRMVSSQWTSNGKAKGKGNKKNGNKYLCWAFSECGRVCQALRRQGQSLLQPQAEQNQLHDRPCITSAQAGKNSILHHAGSG
jgi:transposase